MHYIIGDVHGHFETLKALIAQLPTEAKLVFVGSVVQEKSIRDIPIDIYQL